MLKKYANTWQQQKKKKNKQGNTLLTPPGQ